MTFASLLLCDLVSCRRGRNCCCRRLHLGSCLFYLAASCCFLFACLEPNERLVVGEASDATHSFARRRRMCVRRLACLAPARFTCGSVWRQVTGGQQQQQQQRERKSSGIDCVCVCPIEWIGSAPAEWSASLVWLTAAASTQQN